MSCVLCAEDAGLLVYRTVHYRVVRVAQGEEARRFPAFYRLIWASHAAELSDLATADLCICMDAVATVERVLRQQLAPTKVNLASLGNVVPHLHWHIVARFDWDSHYPAPIWAAPARDEVAGGALARLAQPLAAVDAAVAAALRGL